MFLFAAPSELMKPTAYAAMDGYQSYLRPQYDLTILIVTTLIFLQVSGPKNVQWKETRAISVVRHCGRNEMTIIVSSNDFIGKRAARRPPGNNLPLCPGLNKTSGLKKNRVWYFV